MKKEYKILIIIAVAYATLVALYIAKFDFNLSATIELSENHLAQYSGEIPPGIVVHESDGFDGQYYYMMALNPTLENLHVGANFLQRILYPVLVKILSLNYAPVFPAVFIMVNLASILCSSWALMRLLKKYNANLNLVYLWAFNVGFLLSITRNLTEPLMICFIALMVLSFEKGKHWQASIFLSLALLARELAITVYAAMLLYFLIKLDFKKVLIYALSIIPLSIWEIILIYKTGIIPLVLSSYALSRLPTGLFDYSKKIFPNAQHYVIKPLADATASSLAAQPSSAIQAGAGFNVFNYLKNINKIFSPLPILLFVIAQFFIMVRDFWKEKKISKYFILLLSQVALIALLKKNLFFAEIDAAGRYALPLFFFSILYFAENGKKYSKILAGLIILSSLLYFAQRFILPKGNFWITFG